MPRKPGRPKLPPKLRKSRVVVIRLTDAELAVARRLATARGIKTAAIIREWIAAGVDWELANPGWTEE